MPTPVAEANILSKSVTHIFILLIPAGVSSKGAVCRVMILGAVITLNPTRRHLLLAVLFSFRLFIVL